MANNKFPYTRITVATCRQLNRTIPRNSAKTELLPPGEIQKWSEKRETGWVAASETSKFDITTDCSRSSEIGSDISIRFEAFVRSSPRRDPFPRHVLTRASSRCTSKAYRNASGGIPEAIVYVFSTFAWFADLWVGRSCI